MGEGPWNYVMSPGGTLARWGQIGSGLPGILSEELGIVPKINITFRDRLGWQAAAFVLGGCYCSQKFRKRD
jgi:hypothetical protein